MTTLHEQPTVKTKTLTAEVMHDVPAELKAEGVSADLWAYASVELPDREKDVVRVAGISLKNHTDATPITIIAGHDRTIGLDGYPVVGKAVAFRQTVYKGGEATAPALAFGMEFADTPFGRTMKSLYDRRMLSKFSIGFMPTKAEPIKGGGYDYTASELLEISACVIPMNPHAEVMRALQIDETDADVESGLIMQAIRDLAASVAQAAQKAEQSTNQIIKRLDDIECEFVARSKAPAPTGDHDEQDAPDASAEFFATLAAGLKSRGHI